MESSEPFESKLRFAKSLSNFDLIKSQINLSLMHIRLEQSHLRLHMPGPKSESVQFSFDGMPIGWDPVVMEFRRLIKKKSESLL